jgi:hypothetical protein
MTYTIFIRAWWNIKKDRYSQTVKSPAIGARRTIIAHTNSEEEARAICKQYNETHNPGPRSIKAEYTSQF